MAPVRLTCDIEGCGLSWNVASPSGMKASMEDHRKKCHPGWVRPDSKLSNPYRLDYSGRGRQF